MYSFMQWSSYWNSQGSVRLIWANFTTYRQKLHFHGQHAKTDQIVQAIEPQYMKW